MENLASFEHMIAREAKELSDAFGSFFQTGKGVETWETVRLHGMPDEELDRDPGLVSGDCTAGKPLPFGRLRWLSNVKVFPMPGMHVGNIYLYETESTQGKIWHLDAIQIPRNYDWDSAVVELFSQLWAEAKKKSVSKIIVSNNPSHISNYDYISNAVLKYHNDIGGSVISESVIKEHQFSEVSYSQLQSVRDLEYLVVWDSGASPTSPR